MSKLTFFLVLVLRVAVAQPSDPANPAQYRWRNRLVLLFAPSPEDARYREQTAALAAAAAGLQDREILVFHLFSDSGHSGETNLTRDEIAALRDRLEVVQDAFVLVLVGKDGTVKRRAEKVVSVDDLFDQIDAMPMRQREMNTP